MSGGRNGGFTNILNKTKINSLEELETKTEVFLKDDTEDNSEQRQTSLTPVNSNISKNKGDKHLEFISKILIKPNTEGRASIYTSKQSHNRLKMLSVLTNVNIFDLTDSILNDYFERNKESIETLRKKSSF